MKKILICLAAMAFLLPVNVPAREAEDENEEFQEDMEVLIDNAVKKHQLKFEVNLITPTGTAAIETMDGYTVEVKDGKINARLPYYGESHSALLAGVDELGIVFDNCPIEITEDYSKNYRGRYIWKFSAMSGSEKINVVLTFWAEGTAGIDCTCATRTAISYSGDVISLE